MATQAAATAADQKGNSSVQIEMRIRCQRDHFLLKIFTKQTRRFRYFIVVAELLSFYIKIMSYHRVLILKSVHYENKF